MSSAPVGIFSKSPDSDIPPLVTPTLFKTRKKEDISTITLEKIIGKGAFGTVYSCRDENNDQFAVKCIKTKDFGIPSLIEASIMSVIQHPYLTKALKIHSTPEKLYIVQELAISDLKQYCSNNLIPEEKTLKWIHMIIQGIACLHKYDIIHGDVKASNILVYPDEKVKLTDFTLSTNINWSNTYRPCTPTHRPLEVWLGEKWDKSIDLWALGCTIFEIVYNKNLFIFQERNASINALIDWFNYLPLKYLTKTDQEPKFRSEQKIKYRNTFHYSFSLPDSFNTSSLINHLILSLLTESKLRPTIHEVMKNELFTNFPNIPSIVIGLSEPSSDRTRVKKFMRGFSDNEAILELACSMYSRLTGMINANDKIKMFTCVWIAHKLVCRQNISISILPCELHEVLQMERSICNYLSYKLFSKKSQIVIKDNKKYF